MNVRFFRDLDEIQSRGETAVFCTIVRSSGSTPRHVGSHMIVYPTGATNGSVGGGELETQVIEAAVQVIKNGESRTIKYRFVDPSKGDVGVCGGEAEVFLEAIIPDPKLIVIGAGHVGKAVANLGQFLGFKVIVSDDRPGFCTKDSFPDAEEVIECKMAALPGKTPFTPSTYVVLTTRGTEVDVAGLPKLLEQPFAYLGIIGSRRRWQVTKKELIDKGVSQKLIKRVHSPMGLELNAETPEEIAVSIMAEIIMNKHHGDGKSMKSLE
jgi:xanthine dehydrogenase accessory factor